MLNLEAVLTVLLAWVIYRESLGRRVIVAVVLMAGGGAVLALDVGARSSAGLVGALAVAAATWVTRTGVHVDRIASVWLIRRFVDPQARFKFVPANGYVAEPGELRFDMFDAEFTHVGDRCTYEVLVERMTLEDPALRAIGEIIHDLDLRDGKFGRDETAGVRSVIDGICTVARDDDQRIAAATPMLDGLHSHFTLRARRGGRASKRGS